MVGMNPTEREKKMNKDETKLLLRKEAEAIQKALENGYNDPREDRDLNKTLRFEYAKKKYRRFVEEFGYVEYADILLNQVREGQIDEEYCRIDLVPRLLKSGKIENPIMTNRSHGIKRKTVHGHNRGFSSNLAWGHENNGKGRPIPEYVTTCDIYEEHIDSTGEVYYTKADPKILAALDLRSRIRGNPPKTHNLYNTNDVAYQLREWYDVDKTLGGFNPGGSFPQRWLANREPNPVFDAVMDDLHPEDFLYAGTRTRIYNLWAKGGAQVLEMGEARISGELSTQGWDSGFTFSAKGARSKKRLRFGEWYDEKNKALIGHIKTNGKNLQREVFMNLAISNYRGELKRYQGADICLLVEIYQPSTAIQSLDTQRDKAVEEIQEINDMFKLYGIDLNITKVRFVKQLKNSQDTGRNVDTSPSLNEHQQKLQVIH